MVIAVVGYAFILHHVPLWVAAAIVCVVPLIEAAILAKETPEPYYERGEAPTFMPIPSKLNKFVLAFGLPVALLGFSLGMLRQVSAQLIMPVVSGEAQFVCIAAAAIAALVLAVTGIGLSEDYSWSVYFRVAMPVIAFGALFLPFSLLAVGTLPTIIALCGYLMFEMLLWSFFRRGVAAFQSVARYGVWHRPRRSGACIASGLLHAAVRGSTARVVRNR